MPDLAHLTISSGHTRESPRREVADHVISSLQVIIGRGGGALGNTLWGLLMVERSGDSAIFDVSHGGVEVARCSLAVTAQDEQRLWDQAIVFPTLPGARPLKPASLPWLAVGLLPDGMLLLGDRPELMLELGDLERCIACSLIEN